MPSVDDINSRVARKIVDSLNIKKGEAVTVESWTNWLPFAGRVILEVRKRGGVPVLLAEDEETYLETIRSVPRENLGTMGRHEHSLLSATDVYIFIPGPAIWGNWSPVKPKDVDDSTRYNSAWYDAAEKAGLRGVRMSFGFIGSEGARQLGKDRDEVVRELMKASLVDYQALGRKGREISRQLREGEEAVIGSGRYELRLGLKGESFVEDGIADKEDVKEGYNLTFIPPGYVSKQVDPRSASGKIRIMPSLTRYGLVKDAVLEFEGGELVKWSSDSSGKVLEQAIDSTPVERRSANMLTVGLNGELGYGYGHDRFVAGAIAVSGFGVLAVARNGSLKVGGEALVSGGKLA